MPKQKLVRTRRARRRNACKTDPQVAVLEWMVVEGEQTGHSVRDRRELHVRHLALGCVRVKGLRTHTWMQHEITFDGRLRP